MNQMPAIPKAYQDKILQEAKDYYHKIRSIYDSTGYSQSYQRGWSWWSGGGHTRKMTSIINSDASVAEIIRLTHDSKMFILNLTDPRKEKMVDWHIASLRRCGYDIADLDMAIQESPVTSPAVCVTRSGRLLTPDFLRRISFCLEIQQYCSPLKSKFRIVELGGGVGHLARALKLFQPNSVHVIIDLPETLYLSYLFLRLNFPEAKTCYVTDPSQLKNGIQEFDFVFIPTLFAESILKDEFDLFCNIASLGEMPNPTIRYWMDFIQNRLKVKYFFGLNRFLNTINSHDEFGQRRLNENECSVLFDANWKILQWELEPPSERCPYEAPRIERTLKIIAQRLPAGSTSESDNQLRSQQIVEDLMDEDWIRFPNRYIHGSMQSNVLANDLTMSGTLFKLWESIRLYPNKTNVAMMLEYLHTLTKTGCPFEEWFYYKNLLKSLVARDVRLYPDTTLAEEKYGDLWKRGLVLSTRYDTSSFARLLYSMLSRLNRTLYPKLSFLPFIRKMKQTFINRLSRA